MIIDKHAFFLLKMQSKFNNDVHLGQSINPLNDVVKFSGVDSSYDLRDPFRKINNLKLWVDGTADFDLIRYLSDVAKISRQGQIYNAFSKKAYALPS